MAAQASGSNRTLKQDLSALFQSPRELWIIYFAKFLESLGIFSLLYTVTLWLSKDFGLSDVDAGWWVGTYSTTLTVITFMIGFFADSWGFRSTLIGAFAACAIARGTMAAAQTKEMAIAGLMLLTIGTAGGTPVMNTAIRRYTLASTRAFAFSLYYVTFNVAAAVAGVLIDVAKLVVPTPHVANLPLLGEMQISQYRMTYAIGLGCAIASFLIALSLRKGVDLEKNPDSIDPGTTTASVFMGFMVFVSLMVIVQLCGTLFNIDLPRSTLWMAAGVSALLAVGSVYLLHALKLFDPSERVPEPPAPPVISATTPPPGTAKPASTSPFAVATSVMREAAFWRFMLFVGLLVFVKLIFSHSHFTFPKYVMREMGENFPLGAYQAINPILIIVLVPVATAMTRHRSPFGVIILGSIVTALSPFALVFGASYVGILGMILILSIGECLWSPRLYEYTATIAPRGREASYMGLSSLPMFFAKMAVGPLSGYLLTRYCPEQGPRNSGMMWLIIGIMTLVGPVLILALRGVIEGKKAAVPEVGGAAPAA